MEFVIPTSKDELLSRKDVNSYCVEDLLTIRQIAPALQAFKSACHGNADCIVNNFDTLFSILCLHKDLDPITREDAWTYLLRGCKTFFRSLSSVLDESDLSRDDRVKNLNATKMACYLLCQFMELFDSEATRPAAVVAGKGRGKKKQQSSSSTDMDWVKEKKDGIQMLLEFIQLSLNKLWDPPVAEEEFVSLVSTCCYKLLENPATSKEKDALVAIAHIIGNLVKRYNHGLSASLKIDQLLKHFEFLTSPLAQIVEIIVKDHGCKSIVTEIIREIGNSREALRDSASGKAYAAFLVEIAEKIPLFVLPSMSFVLNLLEGESYTLRNGVLGMMGEILIKCLCKDEVDEKFRVTRDLFFDRLEDHVHDVNAFVRSKVLQIWLNIVAEKSLPLLRQESVMTLVVGRLSDKSSIVRRHALQLVTALLRSNPFAALLPVDELRTNYEKEKALLEEMTPTPATPLASVNDQVTQEWKQIESQFKKSMKAGLESLATRQKELASLIGDDDTTEVVLGNIVKYLEGQEYTEAIMLTYVAMETFPDLPVFAVLNNLNKKSNSEDDEEDSYQEPDVETKLEAAIKEVFFWVKSPLPPHTPDSSMANSTELDEPKTELAKQQTLVNYLKNSLTFALQVQQCIPVVCQLLGSKNTTDVLEAIHFFVTAVEFGVSAAVVGVRRMMVLIWSQEATVRDAVVDAYRTLYLEPKDKNQRFIASSIVKNLSGLVVGSTCGDLTSLEALVTQFVKSGHIGPQVIKALWERFNDKSNAVSEEDARAAVHLIAMCAQAEPDIVKSNVEVLIQEGLGTRAENDYLLALGTCTALLKITSPKEKGKLPSEPFRFEADNSLFERLKVILVKGMTDANTSYWIPLADQAVRVIYELSETPDEVCVKLLRELTQALNDVCSEATQTQGEGGDVPEEPAKSSLVTCMLTRLLAVAGQVAFKQTVYMEDDVLTEMKRRLTLTEDNKKGRRKSRVGAGNGSKAAEMEEDMALAGASAEDTEAEFIRKLCEMEILSTDNFLSGLYPLIIGVCSNSAKFSDPDLQTAATLALARFMIVSSQFCESQLQLLFTLLEKSPSPVIRSNLIIALGDLTFRFPNLVEPWTSHLYARLRDDSSHVRKTTLQVLTHLILNDMVKVKGQISELATCIVDPDDRISGLAKLFFHELAKKGTSMYNMPDIISRLSDPDIGVEENNFHIIIKYIFSHIEKSKHCESLTEKLCHRFRATRTDRQVRDLSFCLSQLTFSEKAISKLLENFQCYADKLVDNDVYGHFCQIISKSRQFIRPEAKAALEELEKKIEQAHTKGLEEGEIENKASKSSVVVKGKTKVVKPRNNSRQKNKSNKENINENEDDETDIVSPLKPKRTTRGNKSVRKPRYTLDSDEEDDEALFDIGREGELERDLDDDDSLLTKPSQKRSKKGKVSLTPLYSPAT